MGAYLDRTVVNEQSIQLVEGNTRAIRLVEDDVGNAAALRVRAIRQLHPLDTTNSLGKVFLSWEKSMLVIQRYDVEPSPVARYHADGELAAGTQNHGSRCCEQAGSEHKRAVDSPPKLGDRQKS